MMKRREFITLLGSATLAAPLPAGAQPEPMIGFLGAESAALYVDRLPAFRQALSEAGFVEGSNLSILYRWADGQSSRLPGLATELVDQRVRLIVAPGSTQAAFAAKNATSTIPIIFYIGSDPVGLGLIASLRRPGGNVTGITAINAEIAAKRLEYISSVVPKAGSVALLINPTNPASALEAGGMEAAARVLGLRFQVAKVINEKEFEAVFASLANVQIDALVIGTDALFNTRSAPLGALSLRYRVPTVYAWRAFAAAGGLMSYGSNISAGFHQIGEYTARILKGEKASDLPVEQVAKIELIINLKSAKALGLEIPLSLLARADEVIE